MCRTNYSLTKTWKDCWTWSKVMKPKWLEWSNLINIRKNYWKIWLATSRSHYLCHSLISRTYCKSWRYCHIWPLLRRLRPYINSFIRMNTKTIKIGSTPFLFQSTSWFTWAPHRTKLWGLGTFKIMSSTNSLQVKSNIMNVWLLIWIKW